MPSSILNSDDGVISGTSGLKSSGGDDGVLVFQSKGTETARINTDSQIVAAAGTASLPALTTTGDVNTGIFFPAADTIAFAEGGAEAMRITSSGEVLVGGTTSVDAKQGAIAVESANGGNLNLIRDDTTVASSNILGRIRFWGNDTTSSTRTELAYIYAISSGAHGAGDNPTDLTFGTTADGSETVAENMRLKENGDLQFNSGYGSVATAYGCRAWVNFNGTGTVAIRASGNVSSITDNGTGDYTVNFTTAMPDANYTVTTSAGDATATNVDALNPSAATAPTTSSVRIIAVRSAVGAYDLVRASVAVFR
jgi:hypothetical protein